MKTDIVHTAPLIRRLRRAFAIGLLAAAALCGLASIPAEASPRRETTRPPTIKPPIVRPPRTGIDGARGYRAPLAAERARWAKLDAELAENPPVFNKKTKKWGFKNTSETFNSYDTARDAWGVMLNVADLLKNGDVKGAKKIWKSTRKTAEEFWYGRVDGELRREIHYGSDKAGKADAKADEAALDNVLDSMWKGLKNAEAKGLKPVKSSSPVTN